MEQIKERLKINEKHFIEANYETTLRLSHIISNIYQNPIFKEKLVLKGGCAVQCYLGNIQRLFFDADFTFLASNLGEFQQEKQLFRNQMIDLMHILDYQTISNKSRYSYSLDSFRFPYNKTSNGNLDYMKVEVNYSQGRHLYPCNVKTWADNTFLLNTEAIVPRLEELLGMKVKALLERGTIKDLIDIKSLIDCYPSCDVDIVRKSYLFYYALAVQRENPASLEKIETISKRNVTGGLLPLLPKNSRFDLNKTKKEVFSFLKDTLVFTKGELLFLGCFKKGEYYPELLFSEVDVVERAKKNPMASYKIMVKKENLNS